MCKSPPGYYMTGCIIVKHHIMSRNALICNFTLLYHHFKRIGSLLFTASVMHELHNGCIPSNRMCPSHSLIHVYTWNHINRHGAYGIRVFCWNMSTSRIACLKQCMNLSSTWYGLCRSLEKDRYMHPHIWIEWLCVSFSWRRSYVAWYMVWNMTMSRWYTWFFTYMWIHICGISQV